MYNFAVKKKRTEKKKRKKNLQQTNNATFLKIKWIWKIF